MLERIDNLLGDWRLDYLGQEHEFFDVRGRLQKIRDRLFAGIGFRDGEESFFEQVEIHIQRIKPQIKTGWINGEPDQEYSTITD